MDEAKLTKLTEIFEKYPTVKLVYFFGSRAENNEGPNSDYDFAVYLEEKDKKKMFDVRFSLMDDVSRALGKDKVDLVILNLAGSPELKYQIIKNGRIIFEKGLARVEVEPRILSEYFDFVQMMSKYGLTKLKVTAKK